jgi:hypothetical protein
VRVFWFILLLDLGWVGLVSAHRIENVDYQAMKKKASAQRGSVPKSAEPFLKFPETALVDWDEKYLYLGSEGLPDHPMMIGITAWQQQVPLPQSYYLGNAWSTGVSVSG